jgi:hypothetical protein
MKVIDRFMTVREHYNDHISSLTITNGHEIERKRSYNFQIQNTVDVSFYVRYRCHILTIRS